MSGFFATLKANGMPIMFGGIAGLSVYMYNNGNPLHQPPVSHRRKQERLLTMPRVVDSIPLKKS